MCRLAAYLGPEISLGRFLMEPAHSLYRQSWEPKEMDEAVLNADGFGFGWVNPSKQTAVYTSTQPIWSDTNLASLSNSLHSRYWLANVRSATPGQQITQTNTHPSQPIIPYGAKSGSRTHNLLLGKQAFYH